MAIRNQRKVTNPPKRLPNQQDSYERLKPKPTGPGLVAVKVPRIRASDKPSPSDARRHADGKNHKNGHMVKAPVSTLKNEPDEGQHPVPSKVKFAKGVPNTAAMRKGYYPPGAKIGKKKHNDTPDYHTPAVYGEAVHSGYD